MTFAFEGKTIHYEIHGTGKPLLLLNGIMMSTASWHVFNDAFLEFKRITVDFYDQGRSSNHEHYTVCDQAKLVNQLIDIIEVEHVHLVGISYGGEVALCFASMYPKKVQTLQLFNTAIHTDKPLYELGESWLKLTRELNGDGFYDATIPFIYGKTFQKQQAAWLKERESHLRILFSSQEFLMRMHRLTQSSQTTDLRKNVSKINMPTQIISGDEDVLIPPYHQEKIHQYIPHATYKKLEHIGHATMYEDKALFETIITKFINQNKGA